MAILTKIGVAIVIAAMVGCTGDRSESAPGANARKPSAAENFHDRPHVEYVAQSYSHLRLMTKEPVLVDPHLSMLCVGVLKGHVNEARKGSGPHAHTSIRIFMNDPAAGAFGSSGEYPVGSIIVKEKKGMEYDVGKPMPQASAKTSDGVGGMIKRPPGYDPEHGDWEYFYFEDASQIEHGKITSCIECHRGAAASDYVFGNWSDGG